MTSGVASAISILVLAAFAGCVASDASTTAATPDAPDAAPAQFDETTGGIEGLVHDDNLLPIPGAMVALGDLPQFSATVDEAGRFSMSHVPLGPHPLFASALGYESTGKQVDVVAGQTVTVEITLVVLPVEEPFYEIKTQSGLMGCGISWRPPTVYQGVSICGALGSTGGVDNFLLVWEVTGPVEKWMAGVFETEWSSTQAFGSGLSINWEPNGCSNDAPTRFVRTQGHSPLRGRLAGAEWTEKMGNVTTSDCSKDECSWDACKLQSRTFSFPDTIGAAAPADVGFTFQQSFDQYVTEFYHEAGAEDFSAIADG